MIKDKRFITGMLVGLVIGVIITIGCYSLSPRKIVVEEFGLVFSDGSVQKVSSSGVFSTAGAVGVVDMKKLRKILQIESDGIFIKRAR